MTTRQRVEWPTVPRRKRKGRKRKLSPGARRALGVGFAVLSLVFLAVGLLTESLLWYLVMALSAGAALAQRRAMQMQQAAAQEKRANRASAPPRARPMPAAEEPSAAEPPPAASGTVNCTATGKPIATCGCASRHVATAEGARRYGLPVGSPMGRRSKERGQPATTRGATT